MRLSLEGSSGGRDSQKQRTPTGSSSAKPWSPTDKNRRNASPVPPGMTLWKDFNQYWMLQDGGLRLRCNGASDGLYLQDHVVAPPLLCLFWEAPTGTRPGDGLQGCIACPAPRAGTAAVWCR